MTDVNVPKSQALCHIAPHRDSHPASPAAPTTSDVARRILAKAGLDAPVTHPAAAPSPDARAFVRAEAEDDDGYDPYSDRPAPREPQFQDDPWD